MTGLREREQNTQEVRHQVMLVVLALLSVMGLVLLVMDVIGANWKFVLIESTALLLTPITLMMLRRGRLTLAGNLLMGGMWLAITVALSVGSGLWSVTMIHLVVVVVISGLLLDPRSLLLWTAASMSTIGFVAGLHVQGHITLSHAHSPVAERAMEQLLALGVVGTAMFFVQKLQDRASRALEREVVERRRAEEVALASASSRERFLATMSHELRTPINGILGASALLEKTELSGEQGELLEMVTDSGDMLLSLINNILDYSRMSTDSIELELLPTRLDELLRTTCRDLAMAARQKGLTAEIRCSPLLPDWQLCDATRLRQVVLNLVGNAVKFTRTGGVRVLALPDGERHWLLRVEDDGIGIPESAQPALFDPFTQADISTSRRFGGTGLGLAIVHSIVGLMGGQISVDSAPGEGSTFTVRLPLQPTDAPPRLEHDDGEMRCGLRVLLVDDHPINRMVAARILSLAGHRVREAVDGFEAVAAATQGGWDVIVMDCQMPGMDGLQATRQIRELPGVSGQVCIVGLSANASPREQDRGLEAGMNRYLTKPIKPDALLAAVSGSVSPL